jgi:hypothetical protein
MEAEVARFARGGAPKEEAENAHALARAAGWLRQKYASK